MSELDLEKLKADCAAANPDEDGFVNALAVTRILNTAIDVIPMLIVEVERLRALVRALLAKGDHFISDHDVYNEGAIAWAECDEKYLADFQDKLNEAREVLGGE